MSKASKEAHRKNLVMGMYPNLRTYILKCIEIGFKSIPDLRNCTGLPEKTISGRLTKLNDLGLIRGKKVGNNSTYTPVTDRKEQREIIAQRKAVTREKWLKKGVKDFGIDRDALIDLIN